MLIYCIEPCNKHKLT